ncbi:MAG: FISUMP domain-containing protein [Candidatus Gracilibacteria bacterium]|nr:FISUMP domain-containing protein [Candidatus Gracilibacteria bacterium]
MKINKTKAFTLVELIVVITILAILATIAFISLNGYASNSRDSKRKSDIASMRKVLELSYLKNNHYPEPDNATNITYSGGLAWYIGEFGEEVRRKVERINPVPKDPLLDIYYAYGVTNNRQEYELGAMLENANNVSMNIINQANANSEGYTTYISGNYNKKIISIRDGNTIRILGVPTLITTNPSITELQTVTDQERRSLFSINNKTNLPGKVIEKINTGILGEGFIVTAEEIYENGTIQNTDVNGGETSLLLYEGTIQDLNNETTKEKVGENIISYYMGTESTIGNLYQEMTGLDGITVLDALISNKQGGLNNKDVALSESSNDGGTSSGGGVVPTYTCSAQPNYTNANFVEGTPTIVNEAWQNTNNINPCYYECINGYTGSECNVAPLVGWRALDINCDIEDITIGTQTWAGCNSTLGTGIEYSIDQNCYNYVGGTTTGCNRPSNEKENVYNATYGVNNIWGKLYTWANSPSACPSGRHVPTDGEWTTLTNYIIAQNGGNTAIGWAAQSGKNETNNLVKALKIPLAGYRNTVGSTFGNRGYVTHLWSSTPNSTNAYGRNLYWNGSTVGRSNNSQAFGFSVRCIKD